ncbi:AAA family ATPase [Bradyrhizobium diazoefficiens]|nr:AAA family ATPase [Bradyrhizobium diazoefficiens]QQN62328.1 AAA family ATPase [Bradyrhizobium diazoefficiens]
MLSKIISIKNVGRFRNSAGSPNPQLAKHTFISGANGFGKTTICAVLRSLHTGDGDHIVGRKTTGVTDDIGIELLFDGAPVRFNKKGWSEPKPMFAIFDGVFVGENVHAGEVVDVAQKRNLYRIIVGEAGVKLATKDAELSGASRNLTAEITSSTKGLQPFLASGMKVDEFLAMAPDANIDVQIEAQQTQVTALQQAETLKKRAQLDELPVPAVPDGLAALLQTTFDDIAADAEALVERHLAAHGMSEGGGNWISSGLDHAADNCPFCGQSIEGLPLVAAFKAIFSERYKNLRAEIIGFRETVARQLGEAALGRLAAVAEKNNAGVEFWKQYVSCEWAGVAVPADLAAAAADLQSTTLALLDAKERGLLDRVEPSAAYSEALKAYVGALEQLAKANAQVKEANRLIAERKAGLNADALPSAFNQLAVLKAQKARHEPAVDELCQAHSDLVLEKREVDDERTEIRGQLDEHTKSVLKPYQNRINSLLSDFNAGFTIAETSHAYPGGVASSSYQLVINGTPIDIGNAKTPLEQPSFKNTLSAGDRTTLALAFFFAHLEADPSLKDKIVVFDDPFTSQDNFRRGQTVHAIRKLAGSCRQLLVLSHDATFLKQIWGKSPASERVSLTLADHRDFGSKLHEIDLEKACQGRTATDIDDLQLFLSTGAGGLLDAVRKMRVVLETYLRTTYPNCFRENEWLGDMVGKIRDGGASHPAAALYDELDQINDYSAQYHHGENMSDSTPDQIDSTALTGYVRRTLKIVNALQA